MQKKFLHIQVQVRKVGEWHVYLDDEESFFGEFEEKY